MPCSTLTKAVCSPRLITCQRSFNGCSTVGSTAGQRLDNGPSAVRQRAYSTGRTGCSDLDFALDGSARDRTGRNVREKRPPL
eukprot:3872770-Rhodomonas_salina.1